MRIPRAVLFLLPLLAACGGGRSSSAPTIPQPHLAAPLGSLGALSEAQSDAWQVTQPLYTPSTNDLLYVSNRGNNSVTVYKQDVSGNTAPLRVIAGSMIGIKSPGQLSEDAQGNLYVASGDTSCCAYPYSNTDAAVLVFAHGANGNVAPVRKLAGSLTGIHYVAALTVDQTTGKIFVSNAAPNGGGDEPWVPNTTILRFPPNATGNVPPFAANIYWTRAVS